MPALATILCQFVAAWAVKTSGTQPSCSAGKAGCGAPPTLEVPRVIVGCWQLLERDRSREHAIQALAKYADAGFTAFDTADIYGPSEAILGEFRSRRPKGASVPRFFTKYVTDSIEAREAQRINDASRKALGVETLDLVQFHFWDLDAAGAKTKHLEAGKQLTALKSAGRIRHLAACNFDTRNLQLLVDDGMEVEANQVQYSLADRRPEVSLLPYCRERGIKILAFGVVAGGLFSDAFLGLDKVSAQQRINSVSRRMYWSSIQAWSRGSYQLYQQLLHMLRKVANRHKGANIAHVASQWVLKRLDDLGAGGGLILGIRDAGHLEEHRRLLVDDHPLTDEDMDEIQSVLDKGVAPTGDIWDRERGWA